MKENQLHKEHLPAFPKAEFSEQDVPGNGRGGEEAVRAHKYFQSPGV